MNNLPFLGSYSLPSSFVLKNKCVIICPESRE
nr:MAG TPA: hypothetical protein [Caudoviricetes sp.]